MKMAQRRGKTNLCLILEFEQSFKVEFFGFFSCMEYCLPALKYTTAEM